jgi:hypothetical protein
MSEQRFELKLANGKRAVWTGTDGTDAATRYVDCHRDAVVIAYREADRHGLHVLGNGRIIQ